MEKNTLIGRNMKQIREEARLSQQEVAEKLLIERSVYSKYETGKHIPPKDRIKAFAELFHIEERILLQNISVVIPDTSCLLKNVRILYNFLDDFQQIIIPDTVFFELTYQKNKNKNNSKNAWNVLKSIISTTEKYPDRVKIMESHNFKGVNDQKISQLAKSLADKQNGDVIIIHDDIDFNFYYNNTILLKDYLSKTNEFCNYDKLLNLNETYLNDWSNYSHEINKNLVSSYLPNGNTLIIECIRSNKSLNEKQSKIEFLIKSGADINQCDNGKYCLTPLSHCVQVKNLTMFKYLIKKGADYNKGSRDETTNSYLKLNAINEGNTPLMIASWHGRISFVKELCKQQNISLNQQDSNGYTALIKCAIQKTKNKKFNKSTVKYKELYDFLLTQPKIDLLIRDRNNNSVLDWWNNKVL